MARSQFGGSIPAWVFSAQDASVQYGAGALVARLSVATTVTFWTAQSGGSQYTDLLASDNTTSITSVSTDSVGAIPIFYGPDTITFVWADAGAARRRLNSNDGLTGPAGTNGTNGVDGNNGQDGAPGPGLNYVLASGGTYPGRPVTATNIPVFYVGATLPNTGGTFAGGGAAVNGDLLLKTPV